MKIIAFRTFGGKDIGYGHLFRCLSLAKAIMNEKPYRIVFVINEEIVDQISNNGHEFRESNGLVQDYEILESLKADLVIVDTYLANDSYLKKIKTLSKLMLFDDNNDIYDSSIPDIVINGNIYASNLNYREVDSNRFLLGPEYLIMQEGYWKNTELNCDKNGILITTGGSDFFNISPNILKELVKTDFTIRVIVGPGYTTRTIEELYSIKNDKTSIIINPNGLIDYIKSSEYVITATGSTIYEVISQKSIPIIFSFADNQKLAYNYFENYGISAIGQYPKIEFGRIIDALEQSKNVNMGKLNSLIDGKGALRVVRHIIQLLS